MRIQLQINSGKGWNNLTSEFYAAGDEKAEAKARRKIEEQMAGWPRAYPEYHDAQFRIIETI